LNTTLLIDNIQGAVRAATIDDNHLKLTGLRIYMLQGCGQGTLFIQNGNDD